MIISTIIDYLESIAPPSIQENYDNACLLTGSIDWGCTGVITCLDATEEIVNEAISKKCNLIVAHHPIIFNGLKKITGKNYIEKTIILAIKNDIAIYAFHTNFDNIITGVNSTIAQKLGLVNCKILNPKLNTLKKIIVFVPTAYSAKIREVIFKAGGGNISNYSECSFNSEGKSTFKPGENANPTIGKIGEQHTENETKIEVIYATWHENAILKAIKDNHPYEEVAYDIIELQNTTEIGSGLIGELEIEENELDFLQKIKNKFNLTVIKHTALLSKKVAKVAVCGGAGSFLLQAAMLAGAEFFISSDIKYHEFFDANQKIVFADIGHYESEQFVSDLIFDILTKKFPTFAIQKTVVNTNPVHYFL